jgi:hypothetical protein
MRQGEDIHGNVALRRHEIAGVLRASRSFIGAEFQGTAPRGGFVMGALDHMIRSAFRIQMSNSEARAGILAADAPEL